MISDETEKDNSLSNIVVIIKKDGRKYSIRKDRHRYFFPAEWKQFINSIKDDEKYILFLTLLNTGARIMEALHLKAKNFDFERKTITFEVVKQRKAKKQFYSLGKSRTFFVSEEYLKQIKKYISQYKIDAEQYLFLDNSKLPADYDSLSHEEKKKYYYPLETKYNALLKRHLKKIGIADWKNFSLHNIRKTYGNWMRIYDIRTEELCYRLGHDLQTFMNHYGSAMIFTQPEKMEIMKILGKVK